MHSVLRTVECNRAYHPRRPPMPPHRHRAQGPTEPSPRARGPFACRSPCTSLVPRGLRDLSLCDQGTWLPIPFWTCPCRVSGPPPPSAAIPSAPGRPCDSPPVCSVPSGRSPFAVRCPARQSPLCHLAWIRVMPRVGNPHCVGGRLSLPVCGSPPTSAVAPVPLIAFSSLVSRGGPWSAISLP